MGLWPSGASGARSKRSCAVAQLHSRPTRPAYVSEWVAHHLDTSDTPQARADPYHGAVIARMRSVWEALNSSYWFVPALLGVGALGLSLFTLWLDQRLSDQWLVGLDLHYLPVIQSQGARAILTTVASSMITVAGVVFSLTLLVLTQAARQFGPRLLVNFMHDRTNQVVLGVFVATFAYALSVLRVVTDGDSDAGLEAFVPQLSLLIALFLTLVTVAVLVYFFHHIAQSVRVTHVLADVDETLMRRLRALAPFAADDDADAVEAAALHERFGDDFGVLRSRRGGYLQEVDSAALVELAAEHDAVIRVRPVVGSFVMRDTPLADVHPTRATDALADGVDVAMSLGEDRSLTQDLGFLFDELLEIALRALSASTNDPFTVRSCIDRIGQGLLQLDRRRLPAQVRHDDDGVARAFVPMQRKGLLARNLLAELRRRGRDRFLVTEHLVTMLTTLRREAGDPAILAAVEEELEATLDAAATTLAERDHARLRAIAARTDADAATFS